MQHYVLLQFVTAASGCTADRLMIEVTGMSVTSVLAIQSDILYVSDQWCIAWGQGGSRGPWQLANLFVNQTTHKRHPMKSIKTNLVIATQLWAPQTCRPWLINDVLSTLWRMN